MPAGAQEAVAAAPPPWPVASLGPASAKGASRKQPPCARRRLQGRGPQCPPHKAGRGYQGRAAADRMSLLAELSLYK